MDEAKSKALAYVGHLLDEQEDMAATINTEAPKFSGSEDERCWKSHQEQIMQLKNVQNVLERA